jgi:hypothetical protein
MITIFSDCSKFSGAKICVFFLKTQFYDLFVTKSSSSFGQKCQIFRQFFCENIFQIITWVPGVLRTVRRHWIRIHTTYVCIYFYFIFIIFILIYELNYTPHMYMYKPILDSQVQIFLAEIFELVLGFKDHFLINQAFRVTFSNCF